MNAGPTVAARIEQIVANAQAASGLEDFGTDSWREGLEVLVRSAETEGRFKSFGMESFYASLVQPLVNRLKIEETYRQYPEIEEQDVRIEFLGVGFPRTGSTALSHLLAEDVTFRNLHMWEGPDPCPPPGLYPEADEARIAAAQALVTMGHEHMAARLRSMLPQSATGPLEDHDLMALEFKAQHFLVSAPHSELRGLVRELRHGADIPLREARAETSAVEDSGEGLAAEEPDAHDVPAGL